MRVKIFSSSDKQKLENEMNAWLESSRHHKIVDKQINSCDALAQQEGAGRYVQITVIIWYM